MNHDIVSRLTPEQNCVIGSTMVKARTVLGLFKGHAERWTRGAYARAGHSFAASPIDPESDQAACFCLSGAVLKIYPNVEAKMAAMERVRQAIKRLFPNLRLKPYQCLVVTFNDRQKTTFADIMKVVRASKI